jgi:hypothetical protein
MPGREDTVSRRFGSSAVGEIYDLQRSLCVAGGEVWPAPFGRKLATVASAIKRHLKCQAVGIRLIDEDGNASYRAQDGFPDDYPPECRSISLHDNRLLCAQILCRESDPATAVLGECGSCEAGPDCRFQSFLLCRIHCMGINLGLIHCADSQPHRFSAPSAKQLEEFADAVGRSLFYDSLWMPAVWDAGEEAPATRAFCSICGRFRDDQGHWLEERRLHPRISWSVLRVPRMICPYCLQFCTAE